MTGKRLVENHNAAFDMKSLGKHIEAVSSRCLVQSHVLPVLTLFMVKVPGDGAQLSMGDEMEIHFIRSLIQSYFNIVRQSIQDVIPKAIMHFLVNHTAQQVQNRLVASLYKPELFSDLLNEDEGLLAERARVKALLEAYREAFKTLADVSLKST